MVHRISRCLDVRKLMTKDEYDPDNDGKISLGIINIDRDLNMGSHNIVLDEGAKVDSVDISEHTHSLSVTAVSDNPTLYWEEKTDEGGEWVFAELTHDFNTEHALICYCVTLENKEPFAFDFWVRVYINGVKRIEKLYNVSAGGRKEASGLNNLEVDEGEDILVQAKVYIGADFSYKYSGRCLIVKSYELLPPSQS